MAITTEMSTQVTQLYVALFGRAPDSEGLGYWVSQMGNGTSLETIAIDMYNTAPARAYYPLWMTNSEIVTSMYTNVLGRAPDAEGLSYWTTQLNNGVSKGKLINDMIVATVNYAGTDATALTAQAQFMNKVVVAEYYVKSTPDGVDNATGAISAVTATSDVSTPAAIEALISAGGGMVGQTYTLTNGTDIASANVFNSGLVYNPAGTDRINALQSEDTLTGTGTNPTLNAVLGNANDNGATSITPTLTGIQTINLDITGNTNTLDLRSSDSIATLAINRITAEAADTVTIDNIGQPAANLTVQNTSKALVDVNFRYTDGVLGGTTANGNAETGNVTLSSVNLDILDVTNNAHTEGFENLTVNSANTVGVKRFHSTDLENLTIKGSGNLSILDTTPAAEHTAFTAGNGLAIGDGIGIRTIDASGFSGTLDIDVTNAVGKHTDPANSGAPFYATITGGTGDDTFWTGNNIVGESATLFDSIDGGAGNNTVRTYASILPDATKAFNARITNVQTLEMRQMGATQTADLDAFDSALTKVLMRDENSANGVETFTLNSVTKALAEGGNIILRHAADSANTVDTGDTWGGTVNINLKDASGSSDTVAVTVENDLNQETKFNYTLTIDGDTATQKVENVTVHDKDTESNVLTLTNAAEHVGTVTLDGGVSGQTYKVVGTLVAKTVDASAQLSDLTLTVGKEDQTIKLGTGSDLLTFDGLDTFNGSDTLTDAGGTDTMRAAFSKDVTGTPSLTGVEKLHIVATENTAIDMSKVTGLTELAIMSDKAVNANNEVFSAGLAGVATTDVITLKNTTLDTINFFGDMDGTGVDGGDVNTVNDSGSYTQTFNGVTLSNNTGDTVAVKISAPLQNVGTGENANPAGDGIKAYNLGQLTTHGVKTMTLDVSNEYSADGVTVAAADALTTVSNIYDKDLVSFTATAKGSMNLGTVSGNALGNNITTFDVSAVGGNFTADVVALGDSAVVTLASGINTFNALGSAGKNVTITSYSAADTITGTAQDDTINSGAGNDTVNGDRGNNVLNVGAGDDVVTAKDGNNTVAFGTGTYETATINDTTGLDGSKAINVFTLEGTAALVNIDSDGVAGFEVTQMLAVGAGSTLRVDWTGSTLNEAGALLDGAKAITAAGAAYTGTANADLVIAGAGEATTFNGGAGNDVLIKLDAAAVTFSGGAGNDTFIGNKTMANLVTGGTGADVIVLASDGTKVANATAAVVSVADGDSVASGYDMVYGYNTAAAATNTLDLVFTNIQANTAGTDGTNVGSVKSHAITNGVVTFDDADTFAASVVVGTGAGQLALADVLSYLTTNLNGTSATVGFAYDSNGNGVTTDAVDSFFIYQDGAADTVVQLVGVQAANGAANVAAVAAAAAANTVVIA